MHTRYKHHVIKNSNWTILPTVSSNKRNDHVPIMGSSQQGSSLGFSVLISVCTEVLWTIMLCCDYAENYTDMYGCMCLCCVVVAVGMLGLESQRKA